MKTLNVLCLAILLLGAMLLPAIAADRSEIKCTIPPSQRQQISPELNTQILLNLMRRLVERKWKTNKPSIPIGYRLRLTFELQPDGQISHIEHTEKSTSKVVDASLIRALLAVSPIQSYKNEDVRHFEVVCAQGAFHELTFKCLDGR